MNKNRKKSGTIKLACDFETVVTGEKDQSETEVWCCGIVDLDDPDELDSVYVGHSIQDFFDKMYSYKANKVVAYFHNLKFDGNFIIDYILDNGYKLSCVEICDDEGEVIETIITKKQTDIKNNEFTVLISAKGQWYTIKIKHNSKIYEIRDSLKLLPFSLKKLGKDFKTKHQKTEIEYTGDRYAGCPMTEQEIEYQKNDCLVLKEALNIMFEEGHTSLTIASCCMKEFKKYYSDDAFKELFPNLYGDNYVLNEDIFGSKSAGEYIRKSYRGGWCFVKPDRKGKVYKNVTGTTADVNSLYPDVMLHNRFCVGYPHFFQGDVPKYVKENDELYYFVRVKTRFYLKENHLPCIQIKGNILYPSRKWLETSDYIDTFGNNWKMLDDPINGGIMQMIPEMTFTKTDWELIKEQYDLEDTEILDGCWFYTQENIFTEYLNKWAEIKMISKGAKRAIAKLFMNSLYGRFATTVDASFKVPYIKDGVMHSYNQESISIQKGAYIPIGSQITALAREKTIRAAQANYDVFCYADTDSIHCLCKPDDIKGAPEHPTKIGFWKYESCWNEAIFTRAKTYIERVTHEDREEVEPYYNVKCAGMPQRSKDLFISKLTKEPLKDEDNIEDYEEMIGIKHLNDDEISFCKIPKMTLDDFKVGLCVPGCLKPKSIKGGVFLLNGDYQMRKGLFD